jgi:hypothetical protein
MLIRWLVPFLYKRTLKSKRHFSHGLKRNYTEKEEKTGNREIQTAKRLDLRIREGDQGAGAANLPVSVIPA